MLYTGNNKQLHDDIKAFMRENAVLEQDICNVLGKSRQNLSTIFNRMCHDDDVSLLDLYKIAKGMHCDLELRFVKK